MTKILLTLDDVPHANTVYHTPPQAANIMRGILTPIVRTDIYVLLFVIGSRLSPPYHSLLTTIQRERPDRILIGNHTFNHINYNNVSVTQYYKDVLRNHITLRRVFDLSQPYYFRPPFLAIGDCQHRYRFLTFLRSINTIYVGTDARLMDWWWDCQYLDALLHDRHTRAILILQDYYRHLRLSIDTLIQRTDRALFHVLLLHANYINRDILPRLLADYRGNLLSSEVPLTTINLN